MSIVETITMAFPGVLSDAAITDEQIRREKNPLEWSGDESLLNIVPRFMLYCAKNPDDNSLISFNTVNALAVYGRSKDPNNDNLNFKFKCDERQRKAVASFMSWARGAPLYENKTQIDRALKNWK